jgi:isopenicillin N synthase-like dioxygenase
MAPTKYVDRTIPEISLHDFESRVDEITKDLVKAAENVGFFCLVNHGISRSTVDDIFDLSARFFHQPDEVKATVPFSSANNAGWEKNAQIRPSTGAVDRKESYQMQFGAGMNGEDITYPPRCVSRWLTQFRTMDRRRRIARIPKASVEFYASSTIYQ